MYIWLLIFTEKGRVLLSLLRNTGDWSAHVHELGKMLLLINHRFLKHEMRHLSFGLVAGNMCPSCPKVLQCFHMTCTVNIIH